MTLRYFNGDRHAIFMFRINVEVGVVNFNRERLIEALNEFEGRERRFGGVEARVS